MTLSFYEARELFDTLITAIDADANECDVEGGEDEFCIVYELGASGLVNLLFDGERFGVFANNDDEDESAVYWFEDQARWTDASNPILNAIKYASS